MDLDVSGTSIISNYQIRYPTVIDFQALPGPTSDDISDPQASSGV